MLLQHPKANECFKFNQNARHVEYNKSIKEILCNGWSCRVIEVYDEIDESTVSSEWKKHSNVDEFKTKSIENLSPLYATFHFTNILLTFSKYRRQKKRHI